MSVAAELARLRSGAGEAAWEEGLEAAASARETTLHSVLSNVLESSYM